MLTTAAGTITPGARLRHRRRRGRPAGHRHRSPAGGGRLRLRPAPRGEGAGAEPRRALRRAAARGRGTPRTRAATRERRTRSFYQRQRELLGRVVAESDVVITAAVVPGKKSPVLVTREMVAGMAPGSVIVDLAAERGGNCELTRGGREGRRARRHHHRLVQPGEHGAVPRQPDVRAERQRVPAPPGQGREAAAWTWSDEIIRETLLTHGGEIVNARVREFFSLPAIETPAGNRRYDMKIGPHDEPVRVHAGGVRRLRGDPPRLPAAAHAADVADQRARRHRGGRRDHPRRARARARSPPCSARSPSSPPPATSSAAS